MNTMGEVTFDNLPQAIAALCADMQIIKQLIQERQVVEDKDEIFNLDQAAAFLNLRPQTIYQMVSEGRVPFMKQSKRLHFSKKDLTAWLKTSSRKPKTEVA